MYLKRLDMHGFKSFAEPVSLEFMDGITCIVGPNGSGKSNIADAIRWVLGEQSPRMLRGGKMEEVIFAGTENRKARGIAEVTLVIENHENILPIEYDEVAITRKMVRSGESEYRINGNPCRLKDIRELIMDTGMGVEGYSIISQGKISDIINNRGEGRRAIFEEAAGIVRYRTRKADAERKLSHASGNLDRVNDIIFELESRIDGLREDSEKAQEYLQLRERGRTIEIHLAVRQVENHEARKETLLQEQEAVEQEETQCSREKEGAEQAVRDIREKLLTLDRESDACNERLRQGSERVAELSSAVEVAEAKAETLRRDRERTDLEILRTERRIGEETAAVESFGQRREELSDKRRQTQEMLTAREADYGERMDRLEAQRESIDEKKSAVFELHSSISVARTEILGLRSLTDGLVKRDTRIQEERIEAEGEVQRLMARQAELEEEQRRLSEGRQELDRRMQEASETLQTRKEEAEELTRRQTAAAGRIHQAVTKRDLLQGFEASYEGYNQAVRFVMNNRHRLPGIRGVLTDLIDVPAGYEIAIQTALGGGIQNIVCDDDASASAAIRLLKSERAGRATFLPVKSVKGGRNISRERNNGALREEPGFVGFAVDLVRFDPEYGAILDYLLGRTVVANSLDSAVHLSKKYTWGMRFVTLEGEEINPSGAITGGRYKRSGPNLFERKNEIRALEQEIRQRREEEEELKKQIQEVSDALTAAAEEADRLSREIRESENRLSVLKNDRKLADSRRAVFEENLIRWQRESADIRKEIAETEEMIAEAERTVSEQSRAIEERETFMDDDIREYEENQQETERLSEEIHRDRIALSSLESDIRHTLSGIRRSEDEIRRLEQEKREREGEKASLEQEREETLEQIRVAKTSLERFRQEFGAVREELEALRAQKEEVNRTLQEREEEIQGLEKRMTDIQGRKYDVRLRISRTDNQIETVKNNLWERYEVTYLEALHQRREDFAVTAAAKESREIRERMKALEPVNIGAIEEYQKVSERYAFLTEQRQDLLESIDSLQAIIVEMDKLIHARFLESFEEINSAFRKTYSELFGGGKAELILEDRDNVLETNVDIVAQPPGKKLQNINLLSGGEKTVTAIALLCALLQVRPTPFCILDEAEAALDDGNIERFIRYLKQFTEIQFIVVTHQKVTMEQADILYGVTMPEKGVSQIVSLKLEEAKRQ